MFASSAATSETTSEFIFEFYISVRSYFSREFTCSLDSISRDFDVFLSTSTPALANSSAKVALLIEPKILSPVPALAEIEMVVAFNFSMIAVAAAINLASSSFLASKVASRAALFLGVARSA